MSEHAEVDFMFVDYIPDELDEGMLYISLEFDTVAHKCLCGCGKEVNTPLSPVDWSLKYDGDTISLDPSIGNWSFDCKSHYWIRRSKVQWAATWSRKKVEAAREKERRENVVYHDEKAEVPVRDSRTPTGFGFKATLLRGWRVAKRWLGWND